MGNAKESRCTLILLKKLYNLCRDNIAYHDDAHFATVVEQDTRAVESLYPTEKSKIRLPNEEIILCL